MDNASFSELSVPNDTSSGNPYLQAALSYAAMGWHVLPVREEPDPQRPGKTLKRPLLSGGHRAATADPDRIREWWSRWPDAAIGVALAASGLAVLDADSREAVDEALAMTDGVAMPVATTPSGWLHFFFRADGLPRGRWTRRGRSGRLDLLADGFVIVPPTLGDGRRGG